MVLNAIIPSKEDTDLITSALIQADQDLQIPIILKDVNGIEVHIVATYLSSCCVIS
jgi:hypothetical protein